MKQRIISAAVALVILAGVFAFYETFVLNIAVSLISAAAVFELLHATSYVKSKALLVFSLGYALVVPFFSTLRIHGMQVYVTLGYFILMFGSLLLYHTEIRFEEVAISFFYFAGRSDRAVYGHFDARPLSAWHSVCAALLCSGMDFGQLCILCRPGVRQT